MRIPHASSTIHEWIPSYLEGPLKLSSNRRIGQVGPSRLNPLSIPKTLAKNRNKIRIQGGVQNFLEKGDSSRGGGHFKNSVTCGNQTCAATGAFFGGGGGMSTFRGSGSRGPQCSLHPWVLVIRVGVFTLVPLRQLFLTPASRNLDAGVKSFSHWGCIKEFTTHVNNFFR